MKNLSIIALWITKRIVAFFNFQYGFRSSLSATNFPTVVSDRIARIVSRFGATQVVALDIFKAFGRVWHTGLLHKLKS